MSDFLAIAAVRGKVLHLVDWDRPVWFLADDPEGDRIVPDLGSMLTDALLFFSFADFDMPLDLFAGQRRERRVFEMNHSKQYSEVERARSILRSRKEPFVLIAHFGKLDGHLAEDIERFSTPILTAQVKGQDAKKFKLG